jgi:hypothetical protein
MSAITCSAANFADDCIRVLEHEAKQSNDALWWGDSAGKIESNGSPDPWWISDSQCIVFEGYVVTTGGTLAVNKARQATSHPDWMRLDFQESRGCDFLTVLVTPARKIRQAAVVHADGLLYWEVVTVGFDRL